MAARLIWAIISTLLEETAIVVVVLWGLPQLGIRISLAGLIAIMVVWGAFAVFTYRKGSQALRRKPEIALPLIGCKAIVVSPLAPKGTVRIKSELWDATSADTDIEVGEEVMVVGQDGLKLMVHRSSPGDLEGAV